MQDYPDGGRQHLNLEQKPIVWQDFWLKTAWKWNKLDREGAHVSVTLLGSANEYNKWQTVKFKYGKVGILKTNYLR